MLKFLIDDDKIKIADFDLYCTQHLADELNMIIDYVLSYELINCSPIRLKLSTKEKQDIIQKEKELLINHLKETRESNYYELSRPRNEKENS